MMVVLNFWFWLTPIVYMLTIIPEKYHWLVMLNPMTGIVMGYQNILVYDKAPNVSILLYPTLLTLFMLLLALITFKKANEEMADVL
jgi:lipopolysaccharide transport system permease protein